MRENMRPRDKRQEEIHISKCDAANGNVMLNSEIILKKKKKIVHLIQSKLKLKTQLKQIQMSSCF